MPNCPLLLSDKSRNNTFPEHPECQAPGMPSLATFKSPRNHVALLWLIATLPMWKPGVTTPIGQLGMSPGWPDPKPIPGCHVRAQLHGGSEGGKPWYVTAGAPCVRPACQGKGGPLGLLCLSACAAWEQGGWRGPSRARHRRRSAPRG